MLRRAPPARRASPASTSLGANVGVALPQQQQQQQPLPPTAGARSVATWPLGVGAGPPSPTPPACACARSDQSRRRCQTTTTTTTATTTTADHHHHAATATATTASRGRLPFAPSPHRSGRDSRGGRQGPELGWARLERPPPPSSYGQDRGAAARRFLPRGRGTRGGDARSRTGGGDARRQPLRRQHQRGGRAGAAHGVRCRGDARCAEDRGDRTRRRPAAGRHHGAAVDTGLGREGASRGGAPRRGGSADEAAQRVIRPFVVSVGEGFLLKRLGLATGVRAYRGGRGILSSLFFGVRRPVRVPV